MDSPGKNTGMGCCFLLQGIFLTHISCIAARFLTTEPPGKPVHSYVAYTFLFLDGPHGMKNFPSQGLNPCPLQWQCQALTTGPPGKSCTFPFVYKKRSCVRRGISLFLSLYCLFPNTPIVTRQVRDTEPSAVTFGMRPIQGGSTDNGVSPTRIPK